MFYARIELHACTYFSIVCSSQVEHAPTVAVGFGSSAGMCRYDAERGIARLQEGWVSLASAQQRRGRAGRVRPGTCYKMFSRRQAGTMEVRAGELLI